MNPSLPKAYSYIRFSTPEQQFGDSLRRQSEAARAYAREHGLDLDDSLFLTDEGVSGFRGKNVEEGRLGAFIAHVESGSVPVGSYLLVESLDRLSRERLMPALGLLQSLLELGIIVVTLSDHKVYTKESLNNLPDLMLSLLIMSRAHEESAMKSQRMKEAWRAKRQGASQGGRPLTAMAPSWLTLDKETGKFGIVESKAEVVRSVFDMYLSGKGKVTIASALNQQGVPPISARAASWHHSYVGRILQNEAVIGRFQPMREVAADEGTSSGVRSRVPDGEPIEDYYPAIVEKDVFFQAQKQRSDRALPRGRRGSGFPNLFRGIAVCGSCGGTMHYVSKGRRRATAKRPNAYLQCSRARQKAGCNHTALWPYFAVEHFVTEGIEDIDFAALFPSVAAASQKALADVLASRRAVAGEEEDVSRRIDNIVGVLADRPDNPALLRQLDTLSERKVELEEEAARLEAAALVAQEAFETFEDRFAHQEELLGQWRENSSDEELRSRLNRSLARSIESMEFHPDDSGRALSYVRHIFRDGEHHWTLVVEPAGARGRYTAYAQPFAREGWEMGPGGGRYWWPSEDTQHSF